MFNFHIWCMCFPAFHGNVAPLSNSTMTRAHYCDLYHRESLHWNLLKPTGRKWIYPVEAPRCKL